MFYICTKCQSKPAITLCCKGKLCTTCGKICHTKFTHPFQYILKKIQQSKFLTDKKTNSKSMVLLRQNNQKVYPKRISRINQNQKIAQCVQTLTSRSSKKYIKQIKNQEQDNLDFSRKSTVNIQKKKSLKKFLMQKQNANHNLIITDQKKCNKKIQKNTLGINTEQYFTQIMSTKDLIIQKLQEDLRIAITQKNELRQKFQKERTKNQQNRIFYQEKLQLIRKIKQK